MEESKASRQPKRQRRRRQKSSSPAKQQVDVSQRDDEQAEEAKSQEGQDAEIGSKVRRNRPRVDQESDSVAAIVVAQSESEVSRTNRTQGEIRGKRRRRAAKSSSKHGSRAEMELPNLGSASASRQIDIDEASLQQLEQGGLHLQYQSKQAVSRIQGKLAQAEELAKASAQELQRQNEQLMKIDTRLNDLDTAASRTSKYITFFRREAATDKITLCLLLIILLELLIFIVALSVPPRTNTVVVSK